MASPLARLLYRALLRLHPRCFRVSFAGEMLLLFDEASGQYGVPWLLGDAALSLARQWLLRSPDAAQPGGAQARFGLLAGSYPVPGPPHLTTAKLSFALLLTLSSFYLFPYPSSYAGPGHGIYSQHHVSKQADIRAGGTYGEHIKLRIRR